MSGRQSSLSDTGSSITLLYGDQTRLVSRPMNYAEARQVAKRTFGLPSVFTTKLSIYQAGRRTTIGWNNFDLARRVDELTVEVSLEANEKPTATRTANTTFIRPQIVRVPDVPTDDPSRISSVKPEDIAVVPIVSSETDCRVLQIIFQSASIVHMFRVSAQYRSMS
jgi:hypothetical protein